jgi:hypothetical protein
MVCWQLFSLSILVTLGFSVAVKCDLFNGYWDKELKWHAFGCDDKTGYNQFKLQRNLTVPNGHMDVLLFGDSNSVEFMEDLRGPYNLQCDLKGGDMHDTVHCVGTDITFVKFHVFSALPYPSEVLNYCVEFAPRNQEGKTFFKTNEDMINFYLQKYHDAYHRPPSIIEFSINFWEFVRMREEFSCETGVVQETAKKRWETNLLDEEYLQLWTQKLEEVFVSLKKKHPQALIYTRTFQLPALDGAGNAVHNNMHSGLMIKQLNNCIRRVTTRVEGIHLVDLERMTNFFFSQSNYLKDGLHCQRFVNEELWNIIWYWYQKRPAIDKY